EELDAVEGTIFAAGTTRDTTSRIYELKRDLLSLKRAVFPLVDIAERLMRDDLIPATARPYFRDVMDHAVRTTDQIDDLLELVATALSANLALIAVAQNDQMKRLAAWAAIIAVPTMLAGIYGMNFHHMPELDWAWGYPAALAVMGGACVALF